MSNSSGSAFTLKPTEEPLWQPESKAGPCLSRFPLRSFLHSPYYYQRQSSVSPPCITIFVFITTITTIINIISITAIIISMIITNYRHCFSFMQWAKDTFSIWIMTAFLIVISDWCLVEYLYLPKVFVCLYFVFGLGPHVAFPYVVSNVFKFCHKWHHNVYSHFVFFLSTELTGVHVSVCPALRPSLGSSAPFPGTHAHYS